MHYSTAMLCRTVQNVAVQQDAAQYSVALYNAAQYNTMRYLRFMIRSPFFNNYKESIIFVKPTRNYRHGISEITMDFRHTYDVFQIFQATKRN